MDLSIERRTCRRFSLILPVLFRWKDGMEYYSVGHCGNVGRGGMFVLSTKCPPMGVQIEIELEIPAFELVPRQFWLRCSGRVIRLESCYQLSGFAVAGRIEEIERYHINIKNEIEKVAVGFLTAQLC